MTPARVLLVDDLPENLEILAELLAPEGHSIETAQSGERALEMAFASPPDLVLLDVQMPGMSGLEVCRRLKADERTRLVPVVLVTGLTERDDRVRGLAAGADDFLSKPVDDEELMARTRSALRTKALVNDLEQAENVLVSLANALEAKDVYTRGHSERVANYAESLGAAAGLGRAERRDLRRAGLLHDIGKIGVPREYLQKPGKLTVTEYDVVKLHPAIGFEICKPLRTMAPLLTLIRGHHERLDGLGYPDGLPAEAIPLALRCLTIADVYDALNSERAYRRALPPEQALAILRDEAGRGLWDLRLVDLLANTVARVG